MQKILFLLFIFSFFQAFSQEDLAMERLYLSERTAAKSVMDFQANPNTGNYDVTHYQLEFAIDPAVAYIEGIVSTTFTAKEPMNSIVFDFDDTMIVNGVTLNGYSLTFTQNANDELVIQFLSTIFTNQSATVVIDYEGNPVSSGFGSFEQSTHNGAPIIWTLSEPYGAKAWWPCKQDLIDKADSIDVIISTPLTYTSVSNGLVINETVLGGIKTTHWEHNHPIPAYLIAIAVSNYTKYTHMAGSTATPFPIDNYVYPENLVTIQAQTPVTVDIMDFYETTFEPYPFNDEKYGHCQFGWGGGMEHTTISFMGGFSRELIAHELAHQWFGDKITCGSWQDIWLNEGFASYLAGMTIQHLDGQTDFNNWKEGEVGYITSEPDGSVYIPAVDTLSTGRVFSGRLTYSKGAMVVHMLRKKLGETTFFQAVQNYLADPDLAFGFAKTPDLKAHLEVASSLNLDEFFQDWVYGEGFPSYQISWHQENNNDVVLTFHQTQSDPSVPFFEAPVNILFLGASGESMTAVFDNTTNGEVFAENIPFPVVSIEIDPYFDLISNNNSASLDVPEFDLSTAILFYPNPVGEKLYVKTPHGVEIRGYNLYNLLGETVQTSSEFNGFISTGNLAHGMYFISAETSAGTVTRKIIKD